MQSWNEIRKAAAFSKRRRNAYDEKSLAQIFPLRSPRRYQRHASGDRALPTINYQLTNLWYNVRHENYFGRDGHGCGRVGGTGRRIYVLGEMGELGADARRFHDEIGELVGELGGDVFVGVGDGGGWMIDAALAHGFKGETVRVRDAAAAGRALAGILRAGDNVLLKASHSIALENVLPAYRKSKLASGK